MTRRLTRKPARHPQPRRDVSTYYLQLEPA